MLLISLVCITCMLMYTRYLTHIHWNHKENAKHLRRVLCKEPQVTNCICNNATVYAHEVCLYLLGPSSSPRQYADWSHGCADADIFIRWGPLPRMTWVHHCRVYQNSCKLTTIPEKRGNSKYPWKFHFKWGKRGSIWLHRRTWLPVHSKLVHTNSRCAQNSRCAHKIASF